MGVSILYNAIPPNSTLYNRVQTEKAFSILVTSLFPYGCGIFRFFEIDPEEVTEILEEVIETHQAAFGSALEADQIIAEFQSELRLTCQNYPGIEDRIASLEKTSAETEELLYQELLKRQITNAAELTQKLMFGDQTLASNLLSEEESLGLISLELVREGANLLRELEFAQLIDRLISEGWYGLDDLERWIGLYLAADENNEEILVGVA